MGKYNLISFLGIFVIMGLAWTVSSNRRVMNWRLIGCGTGLQLLFAAFLFMSPAGVDIFMAVNRAVLWLMDCAMDGVRFLFGVLALPPGETGPHGEVSPGYILAFQALPSIIFFAALIGALYYLKIMPFIIRIFATAFTFLMRISGAEALCASSNIFVGVEASVTIRPHLDKMTQSELFTVLTVGMATIASSVLGFYVLILHNQFPSIAGHLVSASLLSAPAGLVMSKIMTPETGVPAMLGVRVHPHYEREDNIVESIMNGANAGVKLVVGVSAMLIAFLGILAIINRGAAGIGGFVNQWTGWSVDWSLTGLLSYPFYPLCIIMGIPPHDASHLARIIGERLVATEVKSYQDLAVLLKQHVLQNPRSAVIATYALCGFAHVASMAIFVGGIAALAPSRARDLARLGPRALVAATLACLMTGAVAGVFFTKGSVLLGP
jgi:concentrative nucleoside transporter, CNT family